MNTIEFIKKITGHDEITILQLMDDYGYKHESAEHIEPVTGVQLCPKCLGQGNVSRPPGLPADIQSWSHTSTTFVCDVCQGAKVLYPAKSSPAAHIGDVTVEQQIQSQYAEKGNQLGSIVGAIPDLGIESEGKTAKEEAIKELVEGLRNNDETLSYLEDFTHGYEGHKITQQRGENQQLIQKHKV